MTVQGAAVAQVETQSSDLAGTVTGKEFQRRTQHEGPVPVTERPANAIVAPGDFQSSTRWRSLL